MYYIYIFFKGRLGIPKRRRIVSKRPKLETNGNRFPHQSLKTFTFRVKSSYSIFFFLGLFLILSINLTWKVNLFNPFTWQILFNSLKNCRKIDNFTSKSYLKQYKVAPTPQHNIILFELDFDLKFPLLRLLISK